jgi:hypothetical protein
MKLRQKIASLFRAVASSGAGRDTPAVRPGRPLTRRGSEAAPDPTEAFGIAWEPEAERTKLLGDLIEQLALEAYYNGEGFAFSDQELEARVLAFLDRKVESGQLMQRHVPAKVGVRSQWVQAQQAVIAHLLAWWRAHGGPDIEAQVL